MITEPKTRQPVMLFNGPRTHPLLHRPLHTNLGYCPHTVTVYNRATIKVLIMHLYYEYVSTVTGWGQFPTQSLIPLLRDQITRSPERTDRRRAVRSASITSYILPGCSLSKVEKVHMGSCFEVAFHTVFDKAHKGSYF